MLEVFKLHSDANKWNASSFEHIKRVSNTKVGEVGQDFIEKLATELGYICKFPINKAGKRSKQNPWDVEINGVQFELKTATEDTSAVLWRKCHKRYANMIGVLSFAREIANLSKSGVEREWAGKHTLNLHGRSSAERSSLKPLPLEFGKIFYTPIFGMSFLTPLVMN